MKHFLLLIFFLLFVSGVVYAQTNSADIIQDGENNLADVEQEDSGNTLTARTVGDDNIILLLQQGADNIATLTQELESNLANSNLIDLNQSGSGTVTIDQNGSNNRVEGVDDDDDPGTASGTPALFSGSSMTIDQDSNSNVAEVDASGTVQIMQNGSDHAVAIGGGDIVIDQRVDFNIGEVVNDEGITDVLQIGNEYNEVWLEKAHSEGDVDILQDGDHNMVVGLSYPSGHDPLSDPSWAVFTGDDETTALDLHVDQIGSGNVLMLEADGMVDVVQQGDTNSATINQVTP